MSEIDERNGEAQDGAIAVVRPYEHFIEYMQRRAEIESANNSFDVASTMMDKIFTATSAEEIWDADEGGLTSGQNIKDVEMRIESFKVLTSNRPDFDNGLGVYIIVDAVRLSDGEKIIFNTGAAGIIAKLRAFEAKGMLPLECVIRGTVAGNGEVLKLRPVPKRVITASTE